MLIILCVIYAEMYSYFVFLMFPFLQTEGQLFYTGPNRQYMRLVVLSDAQKEAVLQECHSVQCTGKHNGIRSTRNAVVSTYYWSTITEDVKDWVKHVSLDSTEHYCFYTVLFLGEHVKTNYCTLPSFFIFRFHIFSVLLFQNDIN